jgi:hypothetical protein
MMGEDSKKEKKPSWIWAVFLVALLVFIIVMALNDLVPGWHDPGWYYFDGELQVKIEQLEYSESNSFVECIFTLSVKGSLDSSITLPNDVQAFAPLVGVFFMDQHGNTILYKNCFDEYGFEPKQSEGVWTWTIPKGQTCTATGTARLDKTVRLLVDDVIPGTRRY